MRIHCLQHISFETPGSILEWAEQHGCELTVTRLFESEPSFPDPAQFDLLIVLGGAMSVHDEAVFPWLRAEKALLRTAIELGKRVLGICLGAQLLAEALGGRVYANAEPEIGFLPIQFAPEAAQHPVFRHVSLASTVMHWHGETFSLPASATVLASSQACENQAFAYGTKIVGVQFHPELTETILDQMLTHDAHELIPAPFVQTEQQIRDGVYKLAESRKMLFGILDAYSINI
ncbi:type 1 glutamine amidotransferase [Hymenobacter jejuensis]|uniref:Type 1 glutamine amidotransferase n=1 Tax=Hymenobacter jejuensis TaxID=2502781 RepID=A0A5B7ZXU1_9BACT|nr:type 1 glutamine amidotransferase [Hymenobacter jejuensis]QDA58632.1 type 1 glutamine amidotransferase [Hymenobacter jejuensis]